MPSSNQLVQDTAVRDFKRARKAASMQQLMARLQGKSSDLLSYEEVCTQLKSTGVEEKGIQEIPLDAIVGSVGRYKDFTRGFMPKKDNDEERWTGVKTAVLDMKGMRPIDVYQIGEIYFVIDGNHRVSVARQLGTKTITARVTEVKVRVPLQPEDDPDEVICKARYAEFLEKTNLDHLRPDSNLLMTITGQYRLFLEQIDAYRDVVQKRVDHEVAYEEAVIRWYDEVYMPIVRMIREQGIMRYFPEQKEADIFAWFVSRREQLEEVIGWELDLETAVPNIAKQEQTRKKSLFSRMSDRLKDVLIPDDLEEGPAPGEWRKLQKTRNRNILFSDYLVALPGRDTDEQMLDAIISYAKRDKDRLFGLHVVHDKSQINSPKVQKTRKLFKRKCKEAGLVGEFAVDVGSVSEAIIKRAVWVDLVVVSLKHPPGDEPRERLGNRFSKLIKQCPRPMMVLPEGAECPMDRVMLGYDGSPKAKEALFVAAYLASRWVMELTIVTVETENTPANTLYEAQVYLERYGVKNAKYVLKPKPIKDALMETAVAHDINFLIVGGFGFRPMMHLMLGSTVDQLLREFRHPILICR